MPARALLALEKRSERAWFLPAVGVFPSFDYVLPFLPNQILLGGLSMLLPRRWIALAATFVIAAAIGAGLITVAIQQFGVPIVSRFVADMPESSALASAIALVRSYGLAALVAVAMLPWPPRTAVLACAIAGLPATSIGLAVLIGRVAPASLYACIGAKAPHLLRRLSKVDAIMREVEAGRRLRSLNGPGSAPGS
jgi:membrane protein YqaA with SNARE-associated domain